MDSTPHAQLAVRRFLRSYYGRIGIALVLIVGVQLTAIWLMVVVPYQREQQIAQRVRALGGFINSVYVGSSSIPQSIGVDTYFPQSISHISIRDKELPAPLFSDFAFLPDLTHLDLHDCIGVSDSSLSHLKQLLQLDLLDISNSQITDRGLEHLKPLASLSTLNISHSRVTDAGLRHLDGLSGLTSLLMDDAQITDQGLQHLKRHTKLNTLVVGNGQITDAGIEHLKGMTTLTMLGIRNSQITDRGLEHLSGMTSLRALMLNNTRISDAGLEHLKGLTSLLMIVLDNTQTTQEGRSMLRDALPSCTIEPNP